MKSPKSLTLAAVAAAALLSGCFSLQRARIKSTNEEHVFVSNYGWYLFHAIPLACGNSARDAWTPFAFFRNDVTLDKLQGRFMEYANGQGMDVEDLCYTVNDSVMLSIPGIDLPIPVPYLLTYREIQLSGVLTAGERENGETEETK